PVQNPWWQVTLYVTARGIGTSPIPAGTRTFEVDFDFVDRQLVVKTNDGRLASLPLEPMTVAPFYQKYMTQLASLDLEPHIRPIPSELPDTIPFGEDTQHRSYDSDGAERCWHALTQADRMVNGFRGRFLGKCSPSHFWWGAFDLSCTRFSGRLAPTHPGGVPN